MGAKRIALKPKLHRKNDFPVDRTREHLEPGPIVLISSAYKGERNIMTLGWHMMLEYDVVGCYVWDANHSFELFRRSKECVINVPTRDLLDAVVRIGNCHGTEGQPASPVQAGSARVIHELLLAEAANPGPGRSASGRATGDTSPACGARRAGPTSRDRS